MWGPRTCGNAHKGSGFEASNKAGPSSLRQCVCVCVLCVCVCACMCVKAPIIMQRPWPTAPHRMRPIMRPGCMTQWWPAPSGQWFRQPSLFMLARDHEALHCHITCTVTALSHHTCTVTALSRAPSHHVHCHVHCHCTVTSCALSHHVRPCVH